MVVSVQVSIPIDNTPYWYQVDAPVILDKELSPQSKVIYAILSGLTRSTGECWAGNQYISDLLGVSKDTVSRCISELKEKGHICSVVEDKYRRSITLSYARDRQKCLGGTAKMPRGLGKFAEGDRQKPVDNITTNINNEIDNLINTIPDQWQSIMFLWIKYKKEKGQTYKSKETVLTAFKRIVELSGNNPEKGVRIIEQSIANNWAGVFELKGEKNGTIIKQGGVNKSEFEQFMSTR